MSLISLENASLSYGLQVLLDGVDLQIDKGRRLCLIGRNGAGKSTLLKVLAGDVDLDDGLVRRRPELRLSRLEQDLPMADSARVYDVVAGGLEGLGALLAEYHALSARVDERSLRRLGELQQAIDSRDGWRFQQQVEATLTRLQLPAERPLSELSGGWRRRVALARALVCEPDVLLLDEPTNHLDIAAIEWLENQLLNYQGAVVFITHDRSLLQKLATDIAELDRGHLRQWRGDYQSFLVYREQQLVEEARHNALFDKRLAEEETWIRQGIKARRTRNEGRVRALKAMREERGQRRQQQGQVNLIASAAGFSGKRVAELEHVSHGWGEKQLIRNFSTAIMRGDRIGLIGANGMGKSTLLKILLGELQPQSGRVRLGTHLQVAYFDQLREQLDLDKNAVDNIAEGREVVTVDGRDRHIISYLADFLFTGERARTPLRALSGGERNRVLLAKLFSKPSNLLVLDEPTNDLDVETLELLEDVLADYRGTVLLVSHDRAFLDNVVTASIVFEGQGRITEYVGGYQDWLRQGGAWVDGEAGGADTRKAAANASTARNETSAAGQREAKVVKKLSYKLQRELDTLPADIESLETEIAALQTEISGPDFYQQEHARVAETLQYLAEKESALEKLYQRWEELENH